MSAASTASSVSAGPSPGPGALPDINAETYPFDVVQRLLDKAAYFNLYSVPAADGGGALTAQGDPGTVTGVRVSEVLHRFGTPSGAVGEPVARFRHRWVVIPDDYAALPGREPPPVRLDPTRPQRFALLDGECTFEGGDGFRGFGTGLTFPVASGGGRELHAAAVGTLLSGTGRFRDLEGTYTYCGVLDPHAGFRGSLLLRVVDPDERLRARGALPPLASSSSGEPGVSYLVFRGQKRDKTQKTEYSFGPDGKVRGLDVAQDLRRFDLDCAADRDGPRSVERIGPVIGSMAAQIRFNLFDPGAPGTALSPIPFQSYNEYTFADASGRTIGTIVADGGEGRTFQLALKDAPGQRALRFGGFGPLVRGTGAFEGIRGLMSDNSVVGVAPHALATCYVLRVADPDRRFRSAFEGAGR